MSSFWQGLAAFGVVVVFGHFLDAIALFDYLAYAMNLAIGAVVKSFPDYEQIIPPIMAVGFSLFFVAIAVGEE